MCVCVCVCGGGMGRGGIVTGLQMCGTRICLIVKR